MENKKFWFFGSKLNTALLVVLIVLMVIALRWMSENRQVYFPEDSETKINKDSQVLKKDVVNNIKTTYLDYKSNGGTVVVQKGEDISITVGNPGDGGYQFIDPIYDSSVLRLESHVHINPKPNSAPGDFGNDVWKFIAINKGVSDLTIKSARAGQTDSEKVMFTTNVTVK